MRKASLSEIRIWYRFRPTLDIWTSRDKGKSLMIRQPDETWYGGYPFNKGYFMLLQFGCFALHIRFTWWRIRLK